MRVQKNRDFFLIALRKYCECPFDISASGFYSIIAMGEGTSAGTEWLTRWSMINKVN